MEEDRSENRELKLATDFVETTGCHLFLTGKAGTGKTTFLHRLKGTTAKRMVVTAPTGVAAINAGGVTLHSFFQLPFTPFVPGADTHQSGRFRFSKEKKRIINSLDLLVIDEISMVRADLLDAVDAVLRRQRRDERPFGGVQVLMIGDLLQLPPVAKTDQWQLLAPHYDSVYFFSSHVLGRTEVVTVELQRIYRQTDTRFIALLNQVRDNRLDADGLAAFNRRHVADAAAAPEDGTIVLTTHNRSADTINRDRLTALDGEASFLEAEVSGEFPEPAYPAPDRLVLKPGAQVMFLRNDTQPERRYFNGKIGRVQAVADDCVHVRCEGEDRSIAVEPVEWENITYSMDEATGTIREEIVGRFRQYPLKTAWAITIHKSQGLTFDKAVIDAAAAFAHGQVYVGLSRCRTLEGLTLSSPVPSRGMATDPAVLGFLSRATENPPTEEQLQEAQRRYQQELLLECFRFQRLGRRLGYLAGLVLGNTGIVQVSGGVDLAALRREADEKIFSVGEKFRNQLRRRFENGMLPGADPYVLERIAKASAWFQEQFAAVFGDLEQRMLAETDNKELGRRIDGALARLKEEIAARRAGIETCADGFTPSRYLRAVSKAGMAAAPETGKKARPPEYGASDIAHPELFEKLKTWRANKAAEHGLAHYQVMHQRVLIQIAVTLPAGEAELLRIHGIGKKTAEKHGPEIIDIVTAYRESHDIETVAPPPPKEPEEKPEPPKKKTAPKKDTRQASLELFYQGLSIEKIAAERGLTESTVCGHIGVFVETGEVDIDRVIPREKRQAIEAALAANTDNSMKSVKNALGEDVSYGEIKLVIAHRKRAHPPGE